MMEDAESEMSDVGWVPPTVRFYLRSAKAPLR